MTGVQPWRTGMPAPRPDVPLPPARMPLLRGGRPLKRWHYVACFAEDVLLCAATARIGPLPISWWAVWDRGQRTLAERTSRGRALVAFHGDALRVRDGSVLIDLTLGAGTPVETVSPHGSQYAWTRKRGGVRASGTVAVGDRRHRVDALAVVDESAGYHARHTAWRWAAGAGTLVDGRQVAWNLVAGLHDAPAASERTVWVDGEPHEVGPVTFDGLDGIGFSEGGALRFTAEAMRERHDDLRVLASAYEQPFGTFAGDLPGAGRLASGLGVMERHDATW